MSVAGNPAPHYKFGAFELDVRSGELRKHGIRIKLQDQPRQILSLLLEHAGEVVTREQIQQHLWPDNTFVDFDNAINSAVRKLRDALGDTAENPRFVETLARRGYRLMVPVAGRTEPTALREAAPPTVIPKRQKWPIIAAAIVAVGLVAALATWVSQRSNVADSSGLRLTALTANTGVEVQPSFSPDGTRVAFSAGGEDGKDFAVYVKLIGSGDPFRLTKDVGRDLSPVWSPDGRWIAAIRDFGHENGVLKFPASGGQPNVLARVTKGPPGDQSCAVLPVGAVCQLPFHGRLLTWSPDGKYLLTSGKPRPESPLVIMRISVDSPEQQPVTTPPPGLIGDVGPAISPDGRELAFVRLGASGTGDIYVVSLSDTGQPGSQPKRVTSDGADVSAPAWTPDGRELIISSDREGRRELWRISASGASKPVRLAGVGENPFDVAISPQGRRLVWGRANVYGSLWRVPIETGKGGQPVQVAANTNRFKYPHYSPDGKRITYQSSRSGVNEIWVCDADGSNSVQLTNFGRGMSGSPRWSPDGSTIAFDSNAPGDWAIYAIGSEGGRPLRLTSSHTLNLIPNWSRDGHWIYFTAGRAGRFEIWKIHPNGTSETQVTTTSGWAAVESVDGKYLYYRTSVDDGSDICRMPLTGGPTSTVLTGVSGRLFTVTEQGIYYLAGTSAVQLRFFDFASNSARVVTPVGDWADATVSADERWVMYTRRVLLGTNLILVENFR